AELRGLPDSRTLAEKLLARVGLTERKHHFPEQLSGGEQQRVALARAYVCSPEILFADEPTGNLDPETAHSVADLMFELNRQSGTALLIATHNSELANRTEQVFHLHQGALNEAPR